MNTKKIVITGGPGTGKTTVILAIENDGFLCFEEIIRSMTKEAKEKEITNTIVSNPLMFVSDPLDFNKRILNGRIKQYKKSIESDQQFVFYDRGIPDVLAYMDYFSQNYDQNFIRACEHYVYDIVFILPPWKEIYVSDNERLESYEETVEIHEHLEKTYTHYGYKTISVPFGSIEQRTRFILDHINNMNAETS